MKHRVVVARWDEDVSWAAEYPHVVYDKGGDDASSGSGDCELKDQRPLHVVQLQENPEGHESHTYLHHIIRHYDALDDWTTFVQGWPFDHARNFEREWKAEPVNGFAWVGDWTPTDDGDGKPHHFQAILPVGRAYTAIFDRPARAGLYVCGWGSVRGEQGDDPEQAAGILREGAGAWVHARAGEGLGLYDGEVVVVFAERRAKAAGA